MIQNMSLHQAKHMMAAIDGVVRAHHAALETITFLKENVTFLKEKVQALEGHNQGLSDRVAVLEQSSRCRLQEWVGRRKATDVDVAERSEKKLFDDEERAIHQINLSVAHEMRVAHKNAQEQRDQEKRDQKNRDQKKGDQEKRADEKCIVDLCAEVVKKDAKYPLHRAAEDGECNEVLDHFILNRKIHVDAQNWATSGWTPLHCAAMYGRTSTIP